MSLAPSDETYSALSISELPNFTPISTPDKRLINKSRFNMRFLLEPFNKIEAKIDFARIRAERDDEDKKNYSKSY